MEVNQLKGALRSGPVTINFTKTNGEHRRMVATLRTDLISDKTSREAKPNQNPDLLVVFDLENHGWRSMRIESIHDWAAGEAPSAPVKEEPPVLENVGWQPKKLKSKP